MKGQLDGVVPLHLYSIHRDLAYNIGGHKDVPTCKTRVDGPIDIPKVGRHAFIYRIGKFCLCGVASHRDACTDRYIFAP